MFTLAIFCLTTSSLPWVMDLTFQVPMQYCSLQHRTLFPSLVTSITGCCFALAFSLHSFWSFFSNDLQYHTGHLPTRGDHLSLLYLFILYMGFSRQEYWSDLPFPSPVDHILSEFSTMTYPSWVALHSVAHSFIVLDKAMWSDWLVFWGFGFHSVCPLMEKDKRLMESSWCQRLTEGETGSCSDGWGHVQ